VKIDGPSKADIVKKEEKDGIMTYVYVPVSAGEYNINIRFKNKHIHGSPFSAKISGKLGQARIGVGVGRRHCTTVGPTSLSCVTCRQIRVT